MKKSKPIQTANPSGIVDVCVDSDGNPVFLFLDNGMLIKQPSAQIGGVTYIPPPKDSMPWCLPRVSEVIRHFHSDSDDILLSDIEAVIRANTDLPDDKLYSFLAAWVLHTHAIDKFNYSPIIIFHAVHAKGKTRTGKSLLYMSRRAIHLETIREADIIRKASRFGCVMFFDVMDIWKKAERMNAEDILLARFNRGAVVPRVTRPEIAGYGDTQHFSCFGPTIIATNEPAHHILDSRGIVITMRQTSREFDNEILETDFLPFRERATAFRAKWMQKNFPQIRKPTRNRLGEILRPIAQVIHAVAPSKLNTLESLIKTFEGERAESQSETPEGQIVKALLELEQQVVEGRLETREIVNFINNGKNEKFHTSPVATGKRLKAFGLRSARVGDQRGIYYDVSLISSLAIQYGYNPKISAQSGGTAEMPKIKGFATARLTDTPEDINHLTETDGTQQTDPPSICQPTKTVQKGIPPDTADMSDVQGVSNQMPTKWDSDTVRHYAGTFVQLPKMRSLIEKNIGEERCVQEPELPGDF